MNRGHTGNRNGKMRLAKVLILTALALTATGCKVTFLSQYDSGTDQMATALQRATAIHAETMQQQTVPDCFYDKHRDYYIQQHADVGALQQRVNIIPKNQPTIEQVAELKNGLSRFEALHKSATSNGRCQTPIEIQTALSGLDTIFASILRLEIAKQRGVKPD